MRCRFWTSPGKPISPTHVSPPPSGRRSVNLWPFSLELQTMAGELVPLAPPPVREAELSQSSSSSSFFPSSSLPSSSPMRPTHPASSLDSSRSVSPLPITQLSHSSNHTPLTSGRSDVHLVEVQVVHVEDPEHVYVRDDNQKNQFNQLQERINKHCLDYPLPFSRDDLVLGE